MTGCAKDSSTAVLPRLDNLLGTERTGSRLMSQLVLRHPDAQLHRCRQSVIGTPWMKMSSKARPCCMLTMTRSVRTFHVRGRQMRRHLTAHLLRTTRYRMADAHLRVHRPCRPSETGQVTQNILNRSTTSRRASLHLRTVNDTRTILATIKPNTTSSIPTLKIHNM